jgi:CxxC motif-containing protein
LPLVDPNDPVAKAVKYVEDAKKSADSKGNACASCGFYAKKEVRNGKEVGTCTIFAGKLVQGQGWCGSWNKKA